MDLLNKCYIPVSIGELFDKYSILQIKQSKIIEKTKLNMVEYELSQLKKLIDNYIIDELLVNQLKNINTELWDIEDKLRIKEKMLVFDDEFILLARKVYITNDKRNIVKNKISLSLNSDLIEVKSY